MSAEAGPVNENPPPPRKFPAPCWGQHEALALISTYRDRWYALRRGYLRTADWDAVASTIAATSPADPPKTAAQCRHKMEKLRQKYRAEKQRSLSLESIKLPSSWFYYESMDDLESGGGGGGGGGSILAVGSKPGNHVNTNSNVDSNVDVGNYANVFRIKSVGDRSLVEPVNKTKNSKMGIDRNSVNLGFKGKVSRFEGNYKSSNLGYMDGDESELRNSRTGFDSNAANSGFKGKFSNFEGHYRNPNHGLAYMDDEFDGEGNGADEPGFGSGVRFRIPFEEKVVAPVLKAKKFGKIQSDYSGNRYYMNGFNEELPQGFRVKGKMNTDMNPRLFYSDGNSRVKDSVRCEMNTNVTNGVSSFGYGLGKKSDRKRGVKRERGAIDEMVSSIKLLGEGFMRMEKMKMDMAREMEKTRMEMELKRNELIIESQRQIVDAFVSVFVENNSGNNKKKKEKETQTTTIVPELGE